MTAIALPAQIEYLPIDALVPYARNSRTHSSEQVGQLAASIREFGFTNPVLIDERGGIIAGHGRVMAAQSIGLERVPCLRLTHLTDAQKRAYVIADNKLALNAGWDQELLAAELRELNELGDLDLHIIGFSDAELNSLLGVVTEEEAPSVLSAQMTFRVVVECESESQQARIIALLEREGATCRPLMS